MRKSKGMLKSFSLWVSLISLKRIINIKRMAQNSGVQSSQGELQEIVNQDLLEHNLE